MTTTLIEICFFVYFANTRDKLSVLIYCDAAACIPALSVLEY